MRAVGRRVFAAIVGLVVCVVSAVPPSTAGSSSTMQNDRRTVPRSAAEDLDLCALVSVEDLSAAMGAELTATGYARQCDWASADYRATVDASLVSLDEISGYIPDDTGFEVDGWEGSLTESGGYAQLWAHHGDLGLAATFQSPDLSRSLEPAARLLVHSIATGLTGAGPSPPAPSASAGVASGGPATAGQLIARDMDAGVIDQATAVLYQVYSAFGDPQLPEPYASAEPVDIMAAIASATLALDALPADAQELLAPYLARPSDPRSVLHGDAQPNASGSARSGLLASSGGSYVALAPPVMTAQADCPAAGWTSVKASASPVRVWESCQGDRGAPFLPEVAAMMDQVYQAEFQLMGDPILDEGGPDAGGDSLIDIYLIDQCIQLGGRCHDIRFDRRGFAALAPPFVGQDRAWASSGYIAVDRAEVGRPGFLSVLVHEWFHVLEYAHNMQGLLQGDDWHWFVEASATWAEHAFVPDERETEVYPLFDQFQGTGESLTSDAGENEYASFVWPYFMEQDGGGKEAIASAWRAIEGAVGWDAVNAAISLVVPFESRFKEFAVRAWNQSLTSTDGGDLIKPRFQDLVRSFRTTMPGAARHTDLGPMTADPPEAPARTFPIQIPRLGMRYPEFSVDDAVRSLVVDFSGLQPSSAVDVEALIHLKDQGWTRRTLRLGETKFCRDDPEDDVDRMILVLADHSYTGDVGGTWSVKPSRESCHRVRLTLHLDGHLELGSNDYPTDTLMTATVRLDLDVLAPNGLDQGGITVDGGTIAIDAKWTGYCQGSETVHATVGPQDGEFAHIEDRAAQGTVTISAGSVGQAGGPQAYGDIIELSGRVSEPVTLSCGGESDPYHALDVVIPYLCTEGTGLNSGLVLEKTGPATYFGKCDGDEAGAGKTSWQGSAAGPPPKPSSPPSEPTEGPVARAGS
jgi:hypothetical protein